MAEPSPSPAPDSRLVRLAHRCWDRRWVVLAAWVVLLIVATLGANAVGKREASDFRLPGTESQRVYDLLAERFPQQNGDADQLVFAAREGQRLTSAQQARAQRSLDEIARQPGVAAVASPFARDDAQRGGQLSRDGRIALADVVYDGVADDVGTERLEAVQDAAFAARAPGLQVEHGGPGAQQLRFSEGGGAESMIKFVAAAVVLLITFGSVVAAGLPLVTALFALGLTLAGIAFVSQVADTPDFATQLATLIGLGVGIDYALLLLTRYRVEVREGRTRREAVAVAMDTVGRTVIFAAATVVIALLGLLLLGLDFLQGVALGSALAVLLMMAASLTLLPALLSIAGGGVDRLRLPLPGRRRREASGAQDGAGWARWTAAVQRRPWLASGAAILVLAVLAFPMLDLRLGSSDAGVDPPSSTTRQAYDLNAEAFGAGVNGPFLVAVEGGGAAAARTVERELRAKDGIAFVAPAQRSPDGSVATISAVPESGPQDEATPVLLRELRDVVLPRVARETGATVQVGGLTATFEDFADAVAAKLPLFVGVVVLLSALLLLVVFRSVAIPIKAAIMNLLTIGAALGLVTAIFQDGFLAGPLGIETGPIEPFLPVLMFAIVFGLSMDYEVFILARVHEAWSEGADAREAVRVGLARTGRVVTAAAWIMIVVFLAFALEDDRVIKLFGIGLAAAIFIDAFVIRSLLLPAVMELLGRRAWWFPRRLERVVPRLALERS